MPSSVEQPGPLGLDPGESRQRPCDLPPGLLSRFGVGTGELVYCHKLLQTTVSGLPTRSGDAGIRAGNCNAKFALRPDSSVVERGPEKAGVGGSIPSLATTLDSNT